MGVCCPCCRRNRVAVSPERKSIYGYRDLDGEDPHDTGREVLESGAIRLVRSQWLAAQPQTYVVERFQELARSGDAFCEKVQAGELLQELLGLMALSYGWFAHDHPDPQGLHFALLRKFLKIALAAGPGLAKVKPDVYSERAFEGLMWDFMSFPQLPRTADEQATFEMGLQGMCILYGSPNTLVVQLKDMVSDGRCGDGKHMNLMQYSHRGWCTFEEVTSSLFKSNNSHCLLDICLARERFAVEYAKWFEEDSLAVPDDCDIVGVYQSLEGLAISQQQPPIHPHNFRKIVATKKFTQPADCDLVVKLYRTFFHRMCHRQTMLSLNKSSGPGFDRESSEAFYLSKSLPAFKHLETLSINAAIGDDGAQAIAAAMASLPLKNVYFKCGLGKVSLKAISNVLPKLPFLQLLVLPGPLEGCDESKVLQEQWWRCGKPTELEFDDGGLPKSGIHWVHGTQSAAITSMKSLTLNSLASV